MKCLFCKKLKRKYKANNTPIINKIDILNIEITQYKKDIEYKQNRIYELSSTLIELDEQYKILLSNAEQHYITVSYLQKYINCLQEKNNILEMNLCNNKFIFENVKMNLNTINE